MKIHVEVFWVVTSCSDVVGYQHFGGPYIALTEKLIVDQLVKKFLHFVAYEDDYCES
jgi:hypothetical protein